MSATAQSVSSVQLTDEQIAEQKALEEARETFQGVRRQWWGPNELATAQTRIGEILAAMSKLGVAAPVYNFDPENLPEGFGVAVVPKTRRKTGRDSQGNEIKGNEVIGIGLAALPWLDAVSAHEKGMAYVEDCVIGSMVSVFATALRRDDAPSLPKSVEDFIISSRAAESLEAWNTMSPIAIRVLKSDKFGFKDATKSVLRKILSATEFAKQLHPTVPQTQWEMLLQYMINGAKERKMDPGVMQVWLETRDNVEIAEAELDLKGEDIAALFGVSSDDSGGEGSDS